MDTPEKGQQRCDDIERLMESRPGMAWVFSAVRLALMTLKDLIAFVHGLPPKDAAEKSED